MSSKASPQEHRHQHADDQEDPAWASLGLRWGLGLLALFGGVLLLGHIFGEEAEDLGKYWSQTWGYWGAGLGTFLADGMHFPVPPQFYMVLGVAAGGSTPLELLSIAVGSLLGGAFAFVTCRWVAKLPSAQKALARFSKRIRLKSAARHPYRFAVLTSLTPIPYSWLCYAAGLGRMPKRCFGLIALLRIPKLLAYYAVVHAGWSSLGMG